MDRGDRYASRGLPNPFDAAAYAIDAWQRSVIFLDVMRRRAIEYEGASDRGRAERRATRPNWCSTSRRLERPVNYLLARIPPPEGVTIDPRKRPFVIVDPRAGRGPGIGGIQGRQRDRGRDERPATPPISSASCPIRCLARPSSTSPSPQAVFLETVIARHPEAEGKPCVIGNCQAGWAVMVLAALRPELFGPIVIAGTPLEYWAGVRGQYPMRYSGGLLGGSWLTALAGDLSAGIFDGAALVQNFENQNPANTPLEQAV